WTPLEPDQACGLVGIPEPVLEEGRRRVDPFHVERHRSALFCAIVDIAYDRRLPCGYSLLAHRHGRWTEGAFIYAADENPEQFAAAVSLLVGQGNSIEAAIRTELGADAEIAASD